MSKEYIAKVNISCGDKRFFAGQAYSASEIKGLNFNNFLFEGKEVTIVKKPSKKKVVKVKTRGKQKRTKL